MFRLFWVVVEVVVVGLQLKKVFYVFNNYKSQNEGLISVDRSN